MVDRVADITRPRQSVAEGRVEIVSVSIAEVFAKQETNVQRRIWRVCEAEAQRSNRQNGGDAGSTTAL